MELADKSDTGAVIALLKEFAKEGAITPVNWNKVAQVVNDIIDDGICLVLRDGRKIIGSAGLREAELWYSDETVMCDQWFYIHPDYRSAENFEALKAACKSVAQDKGMLLILSISSEHRTEAKIRLFSKDMTLFGASFLYRGDNHVP